MIGRRAIFGLGGLAAILIAFSCAWFFVGGDPVARAESAAKKGRWSDVLAQSEIRLRRKPDDLKALRLRFLALAKLGQSNQVRSEYFEFGVEEMTGGDFLLLAEVLEKDGRDALAWLALEAASRLAPKDSEVRSAMTSLRSRVGRKGEIAHVVDHLSTIPTGPALGELVINLAAWARSETADDATFDHVMARDRATLKAIDSPLKSRLMFARAGLEAEQAHIALETLKKVDENLPEAAWLRSRYWLQRGGPKSMPEAANALVQAGSFAGRESHLPEPARYVGAKACKSCHPKEYAAQQSSRHATTLATGKAMKDVPIPEGPLIDPVNPDVVHKFTRQGDDHVKVEATVGGETFTAWMDYALGSGHHGITMIGADAKGLYRELRISQYSEKGLIWDVTSGFSPRPADPAEYLGKATSSAGVRECIHCHTTRFRSLTDRTGPEAADKGIGCERCHGPGGNHVAAMNYGFNDLAIARFTDATGPQRMTACSGCHASDGTFPPTDAQYIRFQSTTLPFSKCYSESKGKLDCVTCHDPHQSLETSSKFYESKCLDCHGPKTSKGNDAFRRVPCPVNAKSDCLKCHMPREIDAVPHTSFTDHHIRVHREEKKR